MEVEELEEEGFVKDAEWWRKTQKADGGGLPSQEFVLPQVHSLDDVPAVIEHPPDVLCVHGAGEVRVAVVSAVATRSADPKKLVSDEELSSRHSWVFTRFRSCFIWYGVASIFREVVFNFGFSS